MQFDIKYTMCGMGALALGTFIHLMSLDDEAIDYDPRKHTAEFVR